MDYRTVEELKEGLRNTPRIKKVWWRVVDSTLSFFDFPYHIKRVRWFIQRGRRGYADCDWWEMDSYLTRIILPMLKRLRNESMGYPGYGQASTPEKWKSLLDEMIECFEIAQRIDGWDYDLYNDSLADIKLFEKKMKVFTRWFFALWD